MPHRNHFTKEGLHYANIIGVVLRCRGSHNGLDRYFSHGLKPLLPGSLHLRSGRVKMAGRISRVRVLCRTPDGCGARDGIAMLQHAGGGGCDGALRRTRNHRTKEHALSCSRTGTGQVLRSQADSRSALPLEVVKQAASGIVCGPAQCCHCWPGWQIRGTWTFWQGRGSVESVAEGHSSNPT